MTIILGVNAGSATHHDAAAALIDDHGRVLACVEEERISRVRHAPGTKFPVLATARCLKIAGIGAHEVDAVAVGWDEPRLNHRWDFQSPEQFLDQLGLHGPRRPDLHFAPHHLAHAASAFHAGPFEAAAVLVVDGNGEDECASIYRARRGQPLVRLARWPCVYSLGHLYEAASKWLGLGRHGAGKTMGLAAYGSHLPEHDPGWLTAGEHGLISALGTDPTLGYEQLKDRWRTQVARFAGAPGATRPPAELDTDPAAVRVAAAVQATAQRVMTALAAHARELTGLHQLCIAGGVGLNCAANGRIAPPLYVPPLPHDAGVALGAAWTLAGPREPSVFSPYTGSLPGPLTREQLAENVPNEVDPEHVARLLADGRIVAVARGRSEAGPRALCHRSFLASPLDAGMRQRVNSLKRREQWRPFGPVTNADPNPWWSDAGHLERYMIGAAQLTEHGAALLPAVAHADATTRPQRLAAGDEDLVDAVLHALGGLGHPPVLLNTSFNGPGEPLVETATQALACARRLGADALVTDDALLLLAPETR